MKLIRKLLLFIIPAVLVAVIFMSFFLYRSTTKAITDAIKDRQTENAQQLLGTIDRHFHGRLLNIKTVSSSIVFEEIAVARNKKIDASLKIANRDLETHFNALNNSTGPWLDLSIVDTNRRILYSSDKDSVGKQLLEEDLPDSLREALMRGETRYTDIFLDEKLGRPTIVFASAVHNDTVAGKPIIGMAVAHYDWSAALGIIREDKNKVINLYNSRGQKIGDNQEGTEGEILDPKEPVKPQVAEALKHGAFTTIESGINGEEEEVLTSFAKEKGYLDYTGNEWMIGLEVPTRELFAPALRSAVGIIALFIPIAFLGTILAAYPLFRILQPIEQLTKVTQHFANGDLSHRVTTRTNDEIGQLGKSFNRMADSLQALYSNLDQKVREKTAALTQKVEEVETARAKDEALISSIKDGLVATDAQGNIVVINQSAQTLLQIAENAAVGLPYSQLWEIEDSHKEIVASESHPIYQSLTLAKPITESQYSFIRRDQSGNKFVQIPVAFSVSPIILNSKIIGSIIVFRDVSKEREIDRMKTEFISLASHQLRTPLSAIKWFGEMLFNGDAGHLNDEQFDYVKSINESTERMISLVNSLLNISRIESGRIIIDPKPTDLKKLVEDVVKDIHVKVKDRRQNLIISVHENLPLINIDPRLIRQVYMNLITNAVKYTPKDGEISIFISRKDDAIVSQISDNGYGIPTKEKKRVFQKFYRGENITKIETDGTGLGLYLVKAIVDSSGGQISFQSEEGKGTSFTFTLPLAGTKAQAGEVTLES